MIDIEKLRQTVHRHAQVTLSIPIKPQELSELLDRFEAAESECFEQARLNGMGAEREAALMAKLEAAEKERDKYKVAYNEWSKKTEWVQEGLNNGAISPKYLGWHRADVTSDLLKKAEKERDELRAKIEAMEKQEPAAWTTRLALELGSSALGFNACRGNLWGDKGIPLYALPGTKGE